MSFSALLLLFLLILLIYLLYTEKVHPAAAFLFVVSALVVFGVLTPREALAGFSNEQVATIALLLVVSSAMKKFEITGYLFSRLLGKERKYPLFLSKMMGLVSLLSAFLNNTPVVATLMPYVYEWGRRHRISPSKLLIPLSYAAILGGTTTLVGTSTNLIVNALAVESGLPPFHLFDFAWAGVPAVLAGILYMVTVGKRLLPNREDLLSKFLRSGREYLVETFIPPGSPFAGKSVLEAGLRNLKGLFLVEIIRGGERIAPVTPQDILKERDTLIFAGDTESIVELVKKSGGLSLPAVCSPFHGERIEVVEALVPVNSSLVGKKVRETNFRARFDAAILAVHRDGERLKGKIGEMVLKPGDLLLLLAGKDFWSRVADSSDLFVINKVNEVYTLKEKKSLFFLFAFIVALIMSALGVIPLFTSLLILISLLVISGLSTYNEIKKNIDLNLVVIAAFSFAVGIAIKKSGLSSVIGSMIVSITEPLGLVGALVAVYLITNILTEFVTNVAAATMVFPVALSVASNLGASPKLFALVVAYAASASFATPVGYQTNLLVYGPGNYRFKDFLKVGLPLSFIFMSVIISLLILKQKGGA
ncbi:TrkA-C domain protein [Thermovibrio ammonificans HB-1]|uniref:TrkA-C domain protein n=1 Tax=Thermovibrio ammonificans (strain DSM 15698 / JCM 12110 / HB-1) TaxID=648996 RepID=E8T649_THEA1|nr:SLC13 family permease [Thermovibrio ammonificans]ADU96633.1 TrkA-C domain protein [Thermovibrio ammonificans HB-1]